VVRTPQIYSSYLSNTQKAWEVKKNIARDVVENKPNMGDQVWLITSKHTEPLLSGFLTLGRTRHEREDAQFIDIGVEDLVHETDAGRLERILVWQFHMNLPYSSCKRCWRTTS